MTRTKLKLLVGPLRRWYLRHARDLPWRRTTDPYAIWISEIMLQQTQVKTVQPYWERWMELLPDVESLAQAAPERVLKLWEGLGYYKRARNLHLAAQIIMDRHDGAFPTSHSEILDLPGVGRYTAGAIGSIAFNQPVPVLDGNVMRVLTRVAGVRENPREKKINRTLWKWAEWLVIQAGRELPRLERNCSNLNQALMELGATTCTPRQPQCPKCPWQKHCVAFRSGQTQVIPHLGSRSAPMRRRFVAFAVTHGSRVLLRQRPDGVVNAGLWEFPNLEVESDAEDSARLARRCLGFGVGTPEPLIQIRHSITKSRIVLEVYWCAIDRRSTRTVNASVWCDWDQVNRLPFPSAHRRIVVSLNARIS